MISAAESHFAPMPAPILWITGLSGSGKSTLAAAVVQALRPCHTTPLLLDGDAVRDAFEPTSPEIDHSSAMRLQRAWRLARLARFIALQGVPVVVATISLVHAVHAWSRSGDAPYAEVLMSSDLQILRLRNPALYGDELRPGKPHVVGMDIEAEYPLQPELILHQRFEPEQVHEHLQQTLALWQTLNVTH